MTAAAVDLRKPEVFGVLYDATLPGIYGSFLRRCGGRVTTAEDLTSETYLRAIGQPPHVNCQNDVIYLSRADGSFVAIRLNRHPRSQMEQLATPAPD